MPQASNVPTNDPVTASLREPRINVCVAGHYTLTKRYDSRGKPRKFSCRIMAISPHEMAISVPVCGFKGERVITHCEEFGTLEGNIERVSEYGFVMKIAMNDMERAKFAAKLEWFNQVQNNVASDGREHKRIVPKNPHSTLLLADGSSVRCFVVDYSVSGAAVSAEIEPKVGTPLAVGKVVGRVVQLACWLCR
jgi:hypothetical protein